MGHVSRGICVLAGTVCDHNVVRSSWECPVSKCAMQLPLGAITFTIVLPTVEWIDMVVTARCGRIKALSVVQHTRYQGTLFYPGRPLVRKATQDRKCIL